MKTGPTPQVITRLSDLAEEFRLEHWLAMRAGYFEAGTCAYLDYHITIAEIRRLQR